VRVEVEQVSKRFGRVAALRSVGFTLPTGRRVALIGPNGSGKSTLIRILMGLISCEGEVRLDGRSPLRERASIARRLAYAPQAAPQLSAPVREIVAAVCRVRQLDAAALERVAATLGLDLAETSRSPFRVLSGGTKQKLLLALALASEASLLVLDEPTGSLDGPTRDRFFELLAATPPTTTLLLCSHRLDEIRPLVDHVVALEEGRILYDGASSGFLDRCAMSVIEVSVANADACAWLRARGFVRGRGGWWLHTVARSDKRKLVAELAAQLGESIDDLNVRELEELEPPGGRDG
jgi:ABC-type multidrug transport system ATPase subunit